MNSIDLAWTKASPDRQAAEQAQTATVVLFSVTLFTSAFLLFSVQPMVAKQVLPIFGGTPMVWNACVVFFQTTLFAGYVYASITARWRLRSQILIHLALVATVLFALPFVIDRPSAASTSSSPILTLLAIVARGVGVPFFVLSTTSSVVQHWFSHTRQARSEDPYFLYVASNVGSFAALLAYPAVIEPLLPLGLQTRYWTTGYVVFVALVALCGALTFRTAADDAAVAGGESRVSLPPTLLQRARWIAISFIPSSLMLAVTTYLSTDIAAVPLFWIVPLAIYLLTFVIAFGSARHRLRELLRRSAPMLAIPVIMFMSAGTSANIVLTFGLHLALFGVVAQLCHFRLAADRPDKSRLTEFYLCLSLGGMLGGLFNTLAAPLLFTGVREYPLVLAAAFSVILWRQHEEPRPFRAADVVLPIAAGLLAWTAIAVQMRGPSAPLAMTLLGIPAIIAYSQRARPVRFALCVLAMLTAGMVTADNRRELHAERTFFGIYRVIADSASQFHVLSHGTTLHGIQSTDDALRHDPLSYYHRTGPIGEVLERLTAEGKPHAVAVVGLGVGSLAAYAQPRDRWVFYEIDPAVERIARNQAFFTYLDDCGATCQVVLGDARLSLASATADRFDLMVVDAFTSDAIPVHLLTTEAVAVYASRLADHGAIAFHISNKHLALTKVVAAVAAGNNLTAAERFDTHGDVRLGKNASRWIVCAKSASDLETLASGGWTRLTADSAAAWTDDFSNILTALTLR